VIEDVIDLVIEGIAETGNGIDPGIGMLILD